MSDRTIIVYWRWAWLGFIPAIYLSLVQNQPAFFLFALVAYVFSGVNALILSKSVKLPAATVGAATWVFFMFAFASKHLPLAEMWESKGESGLWAAAYVVGGGAAVLFLGLSMDPVFKKKEKSNDTPVSREQKLQEALAKNQPTGKDSSISSIPSNEENSTIDPFCEEEIPFKARKLCSDGNCIGVVADNGYCKECGKKYTWQPLPPINSRELFYKVKDKVYAKLSEEIKDEEQANILKKQTSLTFEEFIELSRSTHQLTIKGKTVFDLFDGEIKLAIKNLKENIPSTP